MGAVAITPAQLKLLHLVLGGGSVIDWHGLDMDEPGRVEKFLSLNAYDITRAADRKRLTHLVKVACDYLIRELDFPLSTTTRSIADIRQLFYIASGRNKNPRAALEACAVLKTAHIINHLDGRQLLLHLPIGLEALYDLLRKKISEVLTEIKARGAPLLKFSGDTKTTLSMVTKLLAKKETIAAEINDRLRFRLITPRKQDIVPLILALFDKLLPFNYVIPGESINDLVVLPPQDRGWPSPVELARKGLVVGLHVVEQGLGLVPKINTFTGSSYRIVQFVVDVPFHLGQQKGALSQKAVKDFGSIVYSKVEFQIVDRSTELANNAGDNSHESYKQRQRLSVLKRIVEG